jgi:hypothetical protein
MNIYDVSETDAGCAVDECPDSAVTSPFKRASFDAFGLEAA